MQAPRPASGESQVSADLRRETSRRAKAGLRDLPRRTPLLVHAAEGKRVFRTDRHDDRPVDHAAGLASGDERVPGPADEIREGSWSQSRQAPRAMSTTRSSCLRVAPPAACTATPWEIVLI